MEDKKDSLLVRKVVEQVQEFKDCVTVEGVVIDGVTYNLELYNGGQDNDKVLILNFRLPHEKKDETPRYRIWIDKKGIKFGKGVYDDGDAESTGGVVGYNLLEKKSGKEKGELRWSEYFPNHPEEEDFFRVPFIDKKK
jgi:hypothetical protein